MAYNAMTVSDKSHSFIFDSIFCCPFIEYDPNQIIAVLLEEEDIAMAIMEEDKQQEEGFRLVSDDSSDGEENMDDNNNNNDNDNDNDNDDDDDDDDDEYEYEC